MFLWQTISVPLLVVDGVDVATDPLEPELVIGFINGNEDAVMKHVPKKLNDALEYFSKGIISSVYASALVLVHNTTRHLLNTRFVEVASRINYQT